MASSPAAPSQPCAAPVARSGSAFDLLKFAGKKSTKTKIFFFGEPAEKRA